MTTFVEMADWGWLVLGSSVCVCVWACVWVHVRMQMCISACMSLCVNMHVCVCVKSESSSEFSGNEMLELWGSLAVMQCTYRVDLDSWNQPSIITGLSQQKNLNHLYILVLCFKWKCPFSVINWRYSLVNQDFCSKVCVREKKEGGKTESEKDW